MRLLTSGTMSLTIDPTTGAATGRLDGSGSGTRRLACSADKTAGQMAWSQRYTAEFSGSVNPSTGAVSLAGTLTGSNSVRYSGCTRDGQTMDCPSGYGQPYSFHIEVTGTVDLSHRTGLGTITVGPIARPTHGTWRFP
jgi:hypothetical protein